MTIQQRDVQRLLGRCLLRLQQYEGLLKSILAHHELSGPPAQLQARHAERISDLATSSLGNLAKILFESYVVARQPGEISAPDEEELKSAESVEITIRTRMTLEMSPDDYAKTKQAIKELVELRNTLVHHFIETFNVWTLEGCAQATEHLTDCYGRIDAQGWLEKSSKVGAVQLLRLTDKGLNTCTNRVQGGSNVPTTRELVSAWRRRLLVGEAGWKVRTFPPLPLLEG